MDSAEPDFIAPDSGEMGCGEPEVWRPHVTVATIVPRDGRFLLVEENVRGRLVLNQPAGHLDPGETLHAAALRETREETGWDVELTCLVGVQQWQAPGGDARHHDPARTLDAGIVRALWLTREEIVAASERLRSPLVLAGIDDWLGGRRLPLDAVAAVGAL